MIQPQYNQTYTPSYPASGASAVNIQIFEPKAYGSAPPAPPTSPAPQDGQQVYDYPQGSAYYPGAPYGYPQIPAYYPPLPPMAQQPPVATEPPVMPQPVIEQPVEPAKVPLAEAQTPVETQAPAEPQVPTPEIKQAVQPKSIVDIASVNQELNSENLNQQTEIITKVAQLSQADPSIALQLVDTEVMQNLAAIITKDTTKLPGPTDAQIKATQKLQKGKPLTPQENQLIEQSSPKAVAEKNKVFAMYTLAMLQKLLRDNVDQYNAQQGNEAVPMLQLQNLTGFEEIKKAIETSTIPEVKAAGIETISYVARPEDAQVVQQFLAPFAADKNEVVKQAAQEAIAKLLGAPMPQAEAIAPKAA